jgi:RimJ/RimL family protein N-acetyltransferase
LKNEQVRVRAATIADSVEILRWRNDLDARKYSRDCEMITFETHQDWFEQVLSDPERVLLIAENTDGQLVGQVRFDLMTTEAIFYEVSITLAPEARGQGFALPLLTAAEEYFLDSLGSVQLCAYIDKDNKASEHLFGSAGYSIDPLTDANGQWWIKEIYV